MALSVFNFRDYREFLKAYYELEKENSKLSFALFAKKAGLNSPNYLKLVIEGARNLTQKNIFLFAKAMNLNDHETAFFETLVQLNQSQSKEEKTFYQRRFSELSVTKDERKKLDPNTITKSWQHPVCAVIAHGKTLPESIEVLHNKYGLKKVEAQKILQYLYDNKVLSLNEADQLTITGSFFSSTSGSGLSLSQEIYLQDQIKVSLREFPKSYRNERGKYIAHTMTTSPEGVRILKSDILDLLAKKSTFFDSLPEGNENLLQVNVQIFEIQKGALS